jgi:hypothetical protein
MRRTAYVCGSAWHQGDRYLPDRYGVYERRIEFRRLTDQGRESVILDRLVCRACIEAEVSDRRKSGRPDTMPLFPAKDS